jgi:hypothetical protein
MSQRHRDSALALKAVDETGRFSGYASVFDIVDAENDVIAKGAFARTLADQGDGSDVRFLWQHDAHEPIGRFERVEEDAYGLYVEGMLLLDVRRAAEAQALLKAGALSGLSIGYRPVRYTIDAKTGIRTITELKLYEISLVTFPANRQARVSGRKVGPPGTIRELEAVLREAGCSRAEAKALAARGFGGLARRDAGADSDAALIASLEHARAALITPTQS